MLGDGRPLPKHTTVQTVPLPIEIPAHGAGRGTLDMTHSPGFGDEAPAPHLDNNQVTLDQDPSAPMAWDSDNDRDLQTRKHTTV